MKKVGLGIVASLFGFVALLAIAAPVHGNPLMGATPQTLELSNVNAEVEYHEHTAKDLQYAKVQTSCYIYGRAIGLKQEQLAMFVSRVSKFKGHPAIAYQMGYVSGILDAFSMADAKRLGSQAAARVMAANHFYEVLKCNPAQSI